MNPPALERLGERIPLGDTPFTLRYEAPDAAGADDTAAIVSLLRRSFNGGPSWFDLGVAPEDHLRWKTADAPFAAVTELTEDGNRIIGLLLIFRHRYLIRGSEVGVATSTDAALEPEYQGQSVSVTRRQVRPDLVPLPQGALTLSFGMHPNSPSRRLQRDERPMGSQIDPLMRILSPTAVVRHRALRRGKVQEGASQTRTVIEGARRKLLSRATASRAMSAVRIAAASLRPSPRPGRLDWTIRTIREFDDRADAFWQEASTQFDLLQVRDREYLNWRYCDPRGGPSMVRIAEQDGELLGYAALRVTPSEVVITDLLALPGRTDVAESLIADALAIGRLAGSATARCWMVANHVYRGSLRRYGFARYDLPTTFRLRREAAEWSELDFLTKPDARVHFMTADTDHL